MASTTLPTDRQGLEVLDHFTCMLLVGHAPVGRVAFMHAGEPLVLPVNHLREGRTVVFRTASGATLDAAIDRRTVAFEVDDYDTHHRTGWSVVLRGSMDIVDDEDEIARLEERDLHPWADAVERPHWVRVRPTEISGRRIVASGA